MGRMFCNGREYTSTDGNMYFNNGGGGGGSTVPFICSTGAQYIELPIYSDDNPVISFKMLQDAYGESPAVVVGDNWSTSGMLIYCDGRYMHTRISPSQNVSFNPVPWEVFDVEFDYATGSLKYGSQTVGDYPSTHQHLPIYLFGLNNTRMSSVGIGEVSIKVSGTEIMHLVPMKDTNTGAGYFHDTVGDTDYYSDSNTDLIYLEIAEV